MARPLLESTSHGLYCPEGDFHVDPTRPAERAVITHAHADHARPGHGAYFAAAPGLGVLRKRIGDGAPIHAFDYGQSFDFGPVRVSLHPAGHLLGSAQVRLERADAGQSEVWVVSGDYKTDPDPTCAPFQPIPCDVFITESTFGLPVYRWPDQAAVFDAINDWRRANRRRGRTSIIYAYALGKAQRVLAGLDPGVGPILLHGAVHAMTELYRDAGVDLPPADHATDERAGALRGEATVIAPPSANGSAWARKFNPLATAFASGWMAVRGARRRRAVDRGFVLSDHADWPGLLHAIEATGASRVGVTHGFVDPLVRWLREAGLDAFAMPTRFEARDEDGPPPGHDAGEAE